MAGTSHAGGFGDERPFRSPLRGLLHGRGSAVVAVHVPVCAGVRGRGRMRLRYGASQPAWRVFVNVVIAGWDCDGNLGPKLDHEGHLPIVS